MYRVPVFVIDVGKCAINFIRRRCFDRPGDDIRGACLIDVSGGIIRPSVFCSRIIRNILAVIAVPFLIAKTRPCFFHSSGLTLIDISGIIACLTSPCDITFRSTAFFKLTQAIFRSIKLSFKAFNPFGVFLTNRVLVCGFIMGCRFTRMGAVIIVGSEPLIRSGNLCLRVVGILPELFCTASCSLDLLGRSAVRFQSLSISLCLFRLGFHTFDLCPVRIACCDSILLILRLSTGSGIRVPLDRSQTIMGIPHFCFCVIGACSECCRFLTRCLHFFSRGARALKLCRMLFSSVGFCFHTGDTVQVSCAGYVFITGFKRSSVSTVIWTGNTGNQALLCILHIRSGRCSGSSQAGSILLCLCDLACRSSCLTKFFNSLLGSCSAGFHCHDGAAVCEPDSALITAVLLLSFCTGIRIIDFCAEPLLCLLNSGSFTARFRSEPSRFGSCSANLTRRSACGFHRNNFTLSKGRAVFHSSDSLAVGGTDERLILLPERTAVLSAIRRSFGNIRCSTSCQPSLSCLQFCPSRSSHGTQSNHFTASFFHFRHRGSACFELCRCLLCLRRALIHSGDSASVFRTGGCPVTIPVSMNGFFRMRFVIARCGQTGLSVGHRGSRHCRISGSCLRTLFRRGDFLLWRTIAFQLCHLALSRLCIAFQFLNPCAVFCACKPVVACPICRDGFRSVRLIIAVRIQPVFRRVDLCTLCSCSGSQLIGVCSGSSDLALRSSTGFQVCHILSCRCGIRFHSRYALPVFIANNCPVACSIACCGFLRIRGVIIRRAESCFRSIDFRSAGRSLTPLGFSIGSGSLKSFRRRLSTGRELLVSRFSLSCCLLLTLDCLLMGRCRKMHVVVSLLLSRIPGNF